MKNKQNYKILSASWIVTCDDKFSIVKDGAIVFDDKIIQIDSLKNIEAKYPNDTIPPIKPNSVLMPGLINSHIHLEFSANKTTLEYGNFIKWLFSVIENREELVNKATKELIDKELSNILRGGTTTIGAISSYGFDMDSCVQTPLNVVYFTEVLGSQASMIDTLFLDFKEKLKAAKQHKSSNFIPAIAIHSPYSTHPFLIREVLQIAKDEKMAVSSHFLESCAENDWLNYSKGEFEPFFKDMLKQDSSLTKPDEFLNHFKGIENLSFTHCVEANKGELEMIKKLNGSIIHCPNSNRLLNNSSLNLDYLDDINLALGTDGLSSNYTLNLFEELKSAFFIHTTSTSHKLAIQLLKSATSGGAKALGLQKGQLSKGFDADIIFFDLPDEVKDEQNLATSIILHTPTINQIYIQGKQIELF